MTTKTGMATAIELLGGAGEIADDADQVDLYGEAETSLGLSEAPRKSGPQGGRPKGVRNRSTEEWRRHFLARYASPLIGLGEIYSRTPELLARELGLAKTVNFKLPLQDVLHTIPARWGENGRTSPEPYVVWDCQATFKLQCEAMQAALTYVHQLLPQAIEVKMPTRGLFVVGDFGGFDGYSGEGLPLADDVENQRVIDVMLNKSDAEKSDRIKKSSENNEKSNASS